MKRIVLAFSLVATTVLSVAILSVLRYFTFWTAFHKSPGQFHLGQSPASPNGSTLADVFVYDAGPLAGKHWAVCLRHAKEPANLTNFDSRLWTRSDFKTLG